MRDSRSNSVTNQHGLFNPFGLGKECESAGVAAIESQKKPLIDIIESDEDILITAEVPEAKKHDMEIEVKGGVLSIKGDREYLNPNIGVNGCRTIYSSFHCLVNLPHNVDPELISARHENGLLTLTIPKLDLAQPDQYRAGMA